MLKTSFLLSVGATLFIAAVIAILDLFGLMEWTVAGWKLAVVPFLAFLAIVGALIVREALRDDRSPRVE